MELVFRCGDTRFNDDGVAETVVKLDGLRHPLPRGMFCRYVRMEQPDGRVFAGEVILQARHPHGRRYASYDDEMVAQKRILQWAKRILRERAKEL